MRRLILISAIFMAFAAPACAQGMSWQNDPTSVIKTEDDAVQTLQIGLSCSSISQNEFYAGMLFVLTKMRGTGMPEPIYASVSNHAIQEAMDFVHGNSMACQGYEDSGAYATTMAIVAAGQKLPHQ